jgi:outer membrane protein assembly factor BamB
VKWMRQLPRNLDPKDPDSDPVVWSGPVLVSDRLILLSSGGVAMSISPYTGEIVGSTYIPDGTFVPPVVANGMVYILTNGAELVALK